MIEKSRLIAIKFSLESIFAVEYSYNGKVFFINNVTSKKLTKFQTVWDIENPAAKKEFIAVLHDILSLFQVKTDNISFSFDERFGIIKAVQSELSASKDLVKSQIEWEFNILTHNSMPEFSFSIPDILSEKGQKLAVALNKKAIQFAVDTSSELGLVLCGINFNVLNFISLLENQDKIQNRNAVLVIINDDVVELALYYHNMIQHVRLIEITENFNINLLNIELRREIETYNYDLIQVFFSKVFITGNKVDKNTTDIIAGALKLDVEMMEMSKFSKLNEKSLTSYDSSHVLLLGSILNV